MCAVLFRLRVSTPTARFAGALWPPLNSLLVPQKEIVSITAAGYIAVIFNYRSVPTDSFAIGVSLIHGPVIGLKTPATGLELQI